MSGSTDGSADGIRERQVWMLENRVHLGAMRNRALSALAAWVWATFPGKGGGGGEGHCSDWGLGVGIVDCGLWDSKWPSDHSVFWELIEIEGWGNDQLWWEGRRSLPQNLDRSGETVTTPEHYNRSTTVFGVRRIITNVAMAPSRTPSSRHNSSNLLHSSGSMYPRSLFSLSSSRKSLMWSLLNPAEAKYASFSAAN